MYREYFGLKELPFSIAPDPRYLYMSDQHREALAHLVYGVNSDGGFVLLTGEVGTGKTTVCRCLLDQLPENSDIAFILNPKMTVEELLATFCDELGIQYPEGNTSIKVFVDRINTYLLDAYSRGRKTVLIIEEAQNLSSDVLEQVRLLTNLETNQRKLLQVIMLGQPELRNMLSKPELRQLSQRITARYHIGSLSKKDMTAYVNHRLAVAGAKSSLFLPSTIDKLFSLSHGIPRLINVICDRALLGAYVQGQKWVDKPTLVKAALEVLGKPGVQSHPMKRLGWVFAGLMLAVSAAALAATFYNHKSQPVQIKIPEPPRPEPITEAPKLDTLQWPSDQAIRLSKETAYEALFKQWDIPYHLREHDNACKLAQSKGLRCLEARGSLSSLFHLNRPAVLKLFDEQGRKFYSTLITLQGQTATFKVGNKIRRVDIKEIEQHWLGDYTLLWRTPPGFQESLRPGHKGKAVQWLERELAIVQGRTEQLQKNYVYDETLSGQVKKFQIDEGLVPDGIVGPQTIIHLNTKIGSGEPLLTKKEENK